MMSSLGFKNCRNYMAGAFSLVAAIGCGVEAELDAEPATENLATTTQMLTIPNPNGIYFANVTANGTGCPSGTWDANIDPLGETFTMTFSQYEVSVDPGMVLDVKDCQIGVELHSPSGLSYSIGEIYFSGYAFLDTAGMTARQTARYYFQGNPIDAATGRTDLTGPHDDEYVFQDTIGLPDMVWSRCGTNRLLNIATRILARNARNRTGTGYVNTLAVDGSVTLIFRLSWSNCVP